MKKTIIWRKGKHNTYQPTCDDPVLATLMLFFEDGLPLQHYIDFLQNSAKQKLPGNISLMEKKDKKVSIFINDDIFPDMPSFTAKIDNLIDVLKEYERLESLGVDIIEITLEDGTLIVNGDWDQ